MANESGYPRKADRPELYHYKLDIALGQGGTGTVYRALDTKTGEVVALKLFRANFFRNSLHQRDLKKSAKKFKKLHHPNIVDIYDYTEGKDGVCLAMEYVDGPDLNWYMKNRPPNLQERLVILAQICNGLGFIHEKGFCHHDMKPANILFTRKGQVKICDYALTGSSILLQFIDQSAGAQVTPMYVAPEIIRKERATKLSDIYSLGIIMYLMFVGHFPFPIDNLQKLYHAHLHQQPIHASVENKDVPRELGDLIMRMIAKDPEKRYQDCDQIRIALSRIGQSRI